MEAITHEESGHIKDLELKVKTQGKVESLKYLQ